MPHPAEVAMAASRSGSERRYREACRCRAGFSIGRKRLRLSTAGGRPPLKGGFDQVADDFAVDGLAGEASHDRFHHLAHVPRDEAPDSVTTALTSCESSSTERAAGR